MSPSADTCCTWGGANAWMCCTYHSTREKGWSETAGYDKITFIIDITKLIKINVLINFYIDFNGSVEKWYTLGGC